MQKKNSTSSQEAVSVIHLNQVLTDSASIKISNEKLNILNEKSKDLEANIVFDTTTNLRQKAHHKVSNKLKKLITEKFINKSNKNQLEKNQIDTCVDDDDDYEDDVVEDSAICDNNFLNMVKDNEIDSDNNIKKNQGNIYRDYFSEIEQKAYPVDENNDASYSISKEKTEQPYIKAIEKNLKFKEDTLIEKNILQATEITDNTTLVTNDLKPTYSGLQPTRVLKKTMTQGSKAIRLMGNDSSGNGPMSISRLSSGFESSMNKNSMIINNNSNNSALSNLNNQNNNNNNNKKLQQKRLFFKNGNINISRSNIDKRRRRYLTDIFTTLIDLKWRYNLLIFCLGFFSTWVAFASIWYFISYIHGDLELTNLENRNYTACVAGISSFSGAILFSIETQQTIGYGVRYTTEKCPEAIFVMMIQSSVGVMIQSFMVGVVFAKLSRPKKRSETLMFSKNAVISLRDGRLCLICRVGDMRKSHIVEAHVRMYLIKKKVTQEGEIMPLHMYDLNVGWDKGLDRLFLVWPLTIEHYIDQNSPFWHLSAEDLKKERFELAVILEGIVESTGMTTQARSSYLVNELLWGHRFEKLITFQKEDGTYKIDYSRFNMTVPVDTPTCSAKDLAELKEQEQFSETFPLISKYEETEGTGNTNIDLRRRKNEIDNSSNLKINDNTIKTEQM